MNREIAELASLNGGLLTIIERQCFKEVQVKFKLELNNGCSN